MGNDLVELELDASSGYFRQIRNRKTGVEHKPPGDGVWPYGVWVGTREEPERMKAEILADGIQEMTHIFERAFGADTLHLIYPCQLTMPKTATVAAKRLEIPLAVHIGHQMPRCVSTKMTQTARKV